MGSTGERRQRGVLVDQDHARRSAGQLGFCGCDLRERSGEGAVPRDPHEVRRVLVAERMLRPGELAVVVMYSQAAEPVSELAIHLSIVLVAVQERHDRRRR